MKPKSKPKPETGRLSLTIDPELMEWLRIKAKADRRSISNMAAIILEDYMKAETPAVEVSPKIRRSGIAVGE